MFALVVDGEYKGQADKPKVQTILQIAREEGYRVEIASFEQGAGWVPQCLEQFSQAA